MASVWLARQRGDGGFSRVVAAKQLFPQFAKDPEFVTMFRDEARLVARIRHPNVIPTLDVAAEGDELVLVMEYVVGESLSRLLGAARRRGEPVDPAIAVTVMTHVLEGLHAAHQATNEHGVPLDIVHRDVSPQNVIVGADGIARVFDFGVAKAAGRLQQTTEAGQIKGKVIYMPPEQIFGESVDRRSDIWAASVVLWEMLAGRPLFADVAQAIRFHAETNEVEVPSGSAEVAALAPVLRRGLARQPDERFATAREMSVALEKAVRPASARRVGQWVQTLARETLRKRAAYVEEIEAKPSLPTQRATPSDTPAPLASGVVEAPPTAPTLALMSAVPAPSSTGRWRMLVALGLLVTAVIAGMVYVSGQAARDTADRGVASDANVAMTSLPSPTSSALSNASASPPDVAPPVSAPPASSPRPNAKRTRPTAPAGSEQRPLAASPSASAEDPLDPGSRK